MSEEFLDAIKAGDLEKVLAMLDADPALANARTAKGVSAAVLAVYYGRRDIADAILARGPELTIFDAATVGDLARVKNFVSDEPSLVNAHSPDGYTPIGLAAFAGHGEIVEFLLAQGADVNAVSRNEFRYTALTGAVSGGHTEIVRVLVANGANVNHRYAGGFTPLIEAAASGNADIVKVLLDHGADVNAKTEDGRTPLSVAMEKGQAEIVGLLHERGARA